MSDDNLLLSADELTDRLVARLRAQPEAIHPGVIRDFCDVVLNTAREWFSKGRPLGGLTTLRLWHLMEAAGFDSPELQRIRREYPEGEYLGRLLAYRIITMNDAKNIAGVSKEGGVFRGIRFEGRLSSMKLTYLQMVEAYGSRLEAAEQSLRQKVGGRASSQPPTEKRSVLDRRDVFQLSKLLESAMPTMRVLVSDDATDELRAYLLELMGRQGMFELGNLVHELSSWRAHQGQAR